MDISALKKLLELHEGRRGSIYKCSAGYNTIGVGHNLDTNPISDKAIDVILEDDIAVVLSDLNKNLPWWRQLSERRQLVLADMCFNLGIGRLLGFKNTLKAMENGNYEEAANGMAASKWAAQVGRRAERLIKMMREG